jgi:hypothetical protein
MTKKVILPIFERRSSRFSKFLLVSILFALFGLILNIYIFNSEILNFCLIGLLILSGIFMMTIQMDKQVGTIILTDQHFYIDDKEIIPIQNIKGLKIKIGGFEGRKGFDNLRSFVADDGKNNFIEFEHNQVYRKFRIFISSKNFEPFIDLTEKWGIQILN